HVYRPVAVDEPISRIHELMARLTQEEIVRKKLRGFRLDTLLVRETRLVSHLGQTAIDRYLEALALLGPKAGWDQELTIPVKAVTTNHRKGGVGDRIVIELVKTEQVEKERQWALEITRRLTGQDTPYLPFRRDITLAMLDAKTDTTILQKRLNEVVPESVTLLPTEVE
ncbi:hypothetical protein KW792_00955, partial [Candidatus Saccharibacteria bacterium]|nr:hypothetical protein [Candidatus Saccharibacteria bacterium]